jgi:hypothetical protein
MMILIAGPYRSGMNDDPEKVTANVHVMESFTPPIFQKGHIPIQGERLVLPLVSLAGSKQFVDETFNKIFHLIAERLPEKCDAVLRVGGPSEGADQMISIARQPGLKVFFALEGIPD